MLIHCLNLRAESLTTLRGCSNPARSLPFSPFSEEVMDERIDHTWLNRVLCEKVTSVLMQMLSSRSSTRWRRRLRREMAMCQTHNPLGTLMRLLRMRARIPPYRLPATMYVLPLDHAVMSRKHANHAE